MVCSNYAERVAKLVLERIFPGSRMCYRRDQSLGEWDFDLKYLNGDTAAVEVTSSRNQALTQIHSEIFDPRRGGSKIQAVRCKFTWLIRPALGANIKRIRRNADRYLAMLEAEGILNFTTLDQARGRVPENLTRLCDELRLEDGRAVSPSGGAEIQMLGIISSRTVDPTTAITAAETEFEPNKKKLGRAGCAERHLLVSIDETNGGAWVAMVDFAPPEEVPKLPEEITHVWLVAQVASDRFIVWSGSSNRLWQRTDLEDLSVNS